MKTAKSGEIYFGKNIFLLVLPRVGNYFEKYLFMDMLSQIRGNFKNRKFWIALVYENGQEGMPISLR